MVTTAIIAFYSNSTLLINYATSGLVRAPCNYSEYIITVVFSRCR